jgi:hypothetical protein
MHRFLAVVLSRQDKDNTQAVKPMDKMERGNAKGKYDAGAEELELDSLDNLDTMSP